MKEFFCVLAIAACFAVSSYNDQLELDAKMESVPFMLATVD